jgi:uncharacterized protein YlbG (UPF0298 family)
MISYMLINRILYVILLSNFQQKMSLFRSAEMNYYTLHIPKEDSYEVVSRLASYDFVQFVDCNTNVFHHQ